MRGWFVTGTDTGVGKTWVSVSLMHALREQGHRVLAMKPVASGCAKTEEGLRSGDALMLQEAASSSLPYERLNPYAFEAAIAPHIAARHAGVSIDMGRLAREARALGTECDYLVVEGVGGWYVPLSGQEKVSDLAVRIGLPVVLVVGMRLGCINHALLTAESIEHSGLKLAGWVANLVDPHMEAVAENVRDLSLRLRAPLLGLLPYMHGHHPRQAVHAMDLGPLLS
jgi:dethiobiotin synthetase